MITPEDKILLEKKGISESQIAEQLACFEKGFPFLQLDGAASIEKGILAPQGDEIDSYLQAWDAYKQGEKTIVKFVPASGAASRMFKDLFSFLSAEYDVPTTDFEKNFFANILISDSASVSVWIKYLKRWNSSIMTRSGSSLFKLIWANMTRRRPMTPFSLILRFPLCLILSHR